MRRWLLPCAVAAGLLSCLATACSEPGAPSSERVALPAERVVLIVIDTLRRDFVSAYAPRVPTPHIDSLAARGQVFPGALAAFHQTTMSMAALFTGRTPSLETGELDRSLEWNGRNWCGLRRFARDEEDACVPAGLPTLAEALRPAGYATFGVVTNALLFRPGGYDRGFEVWVEVGGQEGEPEDGRDAFGEWSYEHRGGDAANRAVEDVLDARETDRFFLYVHYMDVHDHVYDAKVTYAQAVERADQAVGGLLALLEARGLREGTVFLLVSDHGERLGEQHVLRGAPTHFGNPSFEEHLRVPLVVSPPVFEETDAAIRSDDLHDRIRRIAGLPPRPAPPDALAPGELFTSEAHFQTYRRGHWKSYRRRSDGSMTLVDLAADPRESRDVAAAHPAVVARHRARMDALTASLGAPEAPASELTEADRARLRELGYLE
jgi:arylsulfatase A-like enzyme